MLLAQHFNGSEKNRKTSKHGGWYTAEILIWGFQNTQKYSYPLDLNFRNPYIVR
jgi:hypothetical protein